MNTPTSTKVEQLLPCPFCGGDHARTIHIRDGRKVACICGACGKPEFYGPLDKPDAEARAITAWNQRATLTPAPSGEGRDWLPIESAPIHDGAKIIGWDESWGVAEMMRSGAMPSGSKPWMLATFNGQIITAHPKLWQEMPTAPHKDTSHD